MLFGTRIFYAMHSDNFLSITIFFLLAMRNATVIINVAASATVIESQIAFLPNTAGKTNIARI